MLMINLMLASDFGPRPSANFDCYEDRDDHRYFHTTDRNRNGRKNDIRYVYGIVVPSPTFTIDVVLQKTC